ncbi:Pentatricopeptide repeat-containing protein [Acorus calamus]|uniref:Pentatricopeptide repeat-containing protein n=1 Tax=Acorus calamus TaxID=4465 RepID=A0AAV9F6Z9_ACOCL|nr:Pentatricopeptide repeat-containing protein [Acorus calamus]
MRLAGFEPGSATFTAVLAACSMGGGGIAGFGRRVHCDAVKTGFKRDPYVRTSLVGMYARCAFVDDAYGVFCDAPDERVLNALIDMYAKCACFDYARRVFNATPIKDTVAWNSMINGYSMHGRCEEAMELFEEMKVTGTPPDEVTFLALVSACAHTGLVEEGLAIFESMMIAPRIEHYVKLVDMLGKSGRVREACEVIKAMPMEVEEGVWSSLLFGVSGDGGGGGGSGGEGGDEGGEGVGGGGEDVWDGGNVGEGEGG